MADLGLTDRQMQVFFDVHHDLPRQGPGSRKSTERAYAHISGRLHEPDVLDVGCGPGAQTICLAELSRGRITAVDNHAPFLEQLRRRVAAAKLEGRITPLLADMNRLPFRKESFDLIWAEGSIYIVGVEQGLASWRPLLRKQGLAAFTEVSWLQGDRPMELEAFWRQVYPGIASIPETLRKIESAGFTVIANFTLPDGDWWNEYYAPIEGKLPALRKKYADDPEAQQVLKMEEDEMDLHRRYSPWYGYVFYIAEEASA